ncbi:hypothetical protein DWG14_00790 [Streptomyces griseorubiginosus]|uniref:Uncharacterized protein n=1 Tax=Streptomyces griseorubiginosus TaxID=67304 RepID=A0AAI8KVR8_9ACTN|nr:hypothetical protein DWG14_00790 [Streptomyces griseorubiginosus]
MPCQVHGRVPGRLGRAGVHAQQARRVDARQPVQDPRPLRGLGLGHVVAEQRDHVRVVEVVEAARLAVAAERLLQRLGRGRRAQPGVAVEVVGADARPGQHRERVVVLQEQLTAGVEPDRARSALVEQFAGTGHHPLHRGVPVRLHQVPVPPDERPGQPVLRGVRLPAEQVLGPQPAAVDPVHRPSAHPRHPAVDHGDVHGVTAGVQQRGRRHPPLDRPRFHAFRQEGVHPRRPGPVASVRRPGTPGIGDPVRLHSGLLDESR